MGQHGQYRTLVRAALAGVAALWLLPTQALACRLALLLALDVSSSVDAAEYDLQRSGLAQSLLQPDVVAAFLNGPPVALSVYEWSGRRQNVVMLDWQMITTQQDLERAAQTITAMQRTQTRFPTAMGYALGFGALHFRSAPPCERKVIDVSGDGVTNDGFAPHLAYKHFPFDDIVVNGLAVLGADAQVESYYRDEVRHGPFSFVETSQGYPGFAVAMRRKLLRELGELQLGAAGATRSPTTDAR